MIENYKNFLNEDRLVPELDSDVIDVEKLQEYAHGIEICCAGEYGTTYFNPSENHIFVCLGDSNPFDSEMLSSYIKDSVRKGDYNNYDKIQVTIEDECTPRAETDGWFKFNGAKFVPYLSRR